MSSQEQDRIRLIAEAMGWRPVNPDAGQVWEGWFAIGDEADTWVDFDPFTSANDDYAVLEWMRSTYQRVAWTGTEPQRKRWVAFSQNLPDIRDYKIGDYARAALTVLGGQER